jgi:hypothetical protein
MSKTDTGREGKIAGQFCAAAVNTTLLMTLPVVLVMVLGDRK